MLRACWDRAYVTGHHGSADLPEAHVARQAEAAHAHALQRRHLQPRARRQLAHLRARAAGARQLCSWRLPSSMRSRHPSALQLAAAFRHAQQGPISSAAGEYIMHPAAHGPPHLKTLRKECSRQPATDPQPWR